MTNPAIVTIAYNRPDSLKRLLHSLEVARFPEGVSVPLVISIDKSDSDACAKVAEDFKWTHGEKIIMARKERMGLKAHVLACGDLTKEYDNIIVLEDDLVVSPAFYEYTVKALDFTEGDKRIGGISLYNHLFNVHARQSFAAIDDGYDNWYFQLASSWGQAYTKNQWETFMGWYEEHKDKPIGGAFVPANVAGWSEKSWLKYYIAYLIDTDKYFLYPRVSLTTNFGDVGSHAVKADSDLQVPLAMGEHGKSYDFVKLEESASVYDSFFENKVIAKHIGKEMGLSEDEARKSILTDLYGVKPVEDEIKSSEGIKYVLSSQVLPYAIIKTYGKQMRPVDANIMYEVEGEEYRLYDVTKGADRVPHKAVEAVAYLYEYRGISAKQMIEMIKYRIREKFDK